MQFPDFSQSFNRYSYALNNPLKYTDPSGESVVLTALIIGATVGGFSGWMIGNNLGATGLNMAGYIAGGALIGGITGGVAFGISMIGGGAMLASAGAGAVGGAGFSGLSTGWDGNAMLTGAVNGAITGFIGGGIASAIGGGWGAIAGGASANLTNQLLCNGGNFSNVNWGSVAVNGAVSLGMHHGLQYLQYKAMDEKLGLLNVTYEQFSKSNTAYQRSRFWRREQGLYFNSDGTARFVKWKDTHKFSVDFNDFRKGDYATLHTHWAKPNQKWVNVGGTNKFEKYNHSKTYPNNSYSFTTVGGFHSGADMQLPGISFVVGRTTSTYHIPSTTGYNYITPDPFIRFFHFNILNINN